MGISRLSEKNAAVIVAHPDDETLWSGGIILSHPEWKWFIISLCRGSDEDRAPRFYNTLKILKSEGIMGDLDDSPEQRPLQQNEVEDAILRLLPVKHFDLIISHSPAGEYTRHRRHEEAGRAVIDLWYTGKISTSELWTFAYTDSNKKHYPAAMEDADIRLTLPKRMWIRKYRIITQTYGFEKGGFEAETTPRVESFRRFNDPLVAQKWQDQLIKPKN